MQTSEQRRILLVEDDATIREAISAYLSTEDFLVVEAPDGQEALNAFAAQEFSLIILDLSLPKVSGEEVCCAIRASSTVPIIILTAKGELEDRIAGLEYGADDYLVKPFSLRELVARVRALLRRATRSDDAPLETIDFGDLIIDLTGHRVIIEGREVELTASEFKLLVTLAQYPGRVYSRMELIEKVLGYDFEGYERAIDSHIKNLRSKLGDNPRAPHWLFTVHGAGYRFISPNT